MKMKTMSKVFMTDKKQNDETNCREDLPEDISGENRELFRRALMEAMDAKIQQFEEETKDVELSPPSRRHMIRMNRLFRERVGSTFLPFPEADNLYERVRSKIVIKLKINEFIDRRRELRHKEFKEENDE